MGFGGARYNGKDIKDAKSVIDNSQGKKGFSRRNPGHPRNHCSVPNADTNTPCVENYSNGCTKTGFLSDNDEDLVLHYALLHPRVQAALNELNQYNRQTNNGADYIRKSVTLSAIELGLNGVITVGEWQNGTRTSLANMQSVTVVLQHFDSMETDPDAPPHILTCFPTYV